MSGDPRIPILFPGTALDASAGALYAIPLPEQSPAIVDAHAVCALYLCGPIHPRLVTAITRALLEYQAAGGNLRGLLIDARRCTVISMVRFSDLLDSMATLHVPIGVLLGSETQYFLAQLLHNTLRRDNPIGYFTSLQAAHTFLTSGTRP